MQGLLFSLILAVAAGVAFCGPLHSSGMPQIRSPVGTCPPKDGENPTYLPDATDCGTFYECTGGKPEPKQCMQGLCFNPTLNVCDWPDHQIVPLDAVGTCPPRDTNETIFLTDSKNCSIYYICSNGRPIGSACAEGTVWNPKINVCVDPLDYECNLEDKPEIAPRTAVGTCPETDPANPVYLPDSASCQLYYECSNGIPVQNNCAGDLEWNTTLNNCVDPLDSNCKASTTTSSTTTSSTTTQATTAQS